VIRAHLLLTARHCIYDYDSGTWSNHVVFYPGYKNGPNTALGPANGWFGKKLITWKSGAPGYQYDTFLVTTTNPASAAILRDPQSRKYGMRSLPPGTAPLGPVIVVTRE
jgi:hypothetical protein